jgi:hypothetical protein
MQRRIKKERKIEMKNCQQKELLGVHDSSENLRRLHSRSKTTQKKAIRNGKLKLAEERRRLRQ